jgi:hypothetical protein
MRLETIILQLWANRNWQKFAQLAFHLNMRRLADNSKAIKVYTLMEASK